MLALISILIQTAMLKATPSGAWLWESDFKLFVGVGYVVPALIAHDMGRQGVVRTVKSVMYAATLVAIPIALALAFDVPGVNDLAPLEGFGDMAIDTAWLPFAVLLSAAAAWGVATNYGMRSGGFVGAAFIGMFMGDPWQVLVAGAIAAATYLIVTRLLMNHMILFGRRKFSSMLLVGSSLSWVLLWSGREFFGPEVQHHLDLGSLALTPLFLPGLLANDAQRTSPRKVVLGVAMASTFVLTWTWWAQSLFEGLALATRVEGGRRRRLRRHLLASGGPRARTQHRRRHVRQPPSSTSYQWPFRCRVADRRWRPGSRRRLEWAAIGDGRPPTRLPLRPPNAGSRRSSATVPSGFPLALSAAGPIDTGWSPRRGLRPPQIEQLRTSALAARSGAAPLPSVPTYRRLPTYRVLEKDPLRVDARLPRMIRAPRAARGRVARRRT